MDAPDILQIYQSCTRGSEAAPVSMRGFDEIAHGLKLTGYWPLNEAPGKALDLSVNSNDATIIEDSVPGNPGLLTSAENADDSAYIFNGTNEVLDIGTGSLHAAIHMIGTGDFTVFAWVKTAADLTQGSPQTIFASNQIAVPYSPQIGLILFASEAVQGGGNGGKAYFFMADGSGDPAVMSDSVLLGDDKAHFIIARRTDGVLSLMVDGINQADTQASSVALRDTGPRATCVGANHMGAGYSSYFKGTIQKVGICTNDSISDAHLIRLYLSGVLAAGPVFHLRLNETSGTVAANAAGPDATYIGSPTLGDADSPFSNDPDAVSVQLNGTTDYIDTGITDAAALAGVGAKLTAAIWFKTNTSNSMALITKGKWSGDAKQQELHINADGSVAANIYNAAGDNANVNTNNGTGGDFSDGQWHHAAVTLDTAGDGLLRLYVDSALNFTATRVLADIRAGSGKLLVGATDNDGTVEMYFNGNLTEARLYNVALSALEIKNLYNAASLP